MTTPSVGKAAMVAGPTIVLLLIVVFGASYLVSVALGLPRSLGLPAGVQILGGALVVVGVAVAVWVFRYRSPANMVVSTYITFTKMLRRSPISEPLGRTEPLVVAGPQRYVRNPLYFGVIVMTFGWALFVGYTFVLLGAVGVLLWFRLVLIPFEERELAALFGEQYMEYMRDVPMLIPFTRRKR